MTKKPLQTLFEAMYHDKQDFNDFATGDIERHFSRKPIVDESGKHRNVVIPDRVLRKYHSFLNLFIFNRLPIKDDVVFSYRKGTNVAAAVRKHSGSRHFYQTDFLNFFGSITADMVRHSILQAEDLLPVAHIGDYLNRILDLVIVDNSLPMGFSTSPVISNAVLLSFDEKFTSYCNDRQLVYTRYSDDITVSSNEKGPLLELDGVIEGLLIDCGYSLMKINRAKSKISSKGRKVKILGLVVLPNGQISLDAKVKNRIETLLHLYVNDQPALSRVIENDSDDGFATLSGLLNYANTVDKTYLDKLRRKYGVTVVDILIHQPKKIETRQAK
ncbi:reverse transcriptase domain-containing protein [Paraburkholderia strydomiana]|uniref:reverse transcriptase domain-containing protein n=1 Tax=Paraburkholderia strydomiana TaxID=1245417 RepID=UPI0038BD68F5